MCTLGEECYLSATTSTYAIRVGISSVGPCEVKFHSAAGPLSHCPPQPQSHLARRGVPASTIDPREPVDEVGGSTAIDGRISAGDAELRSHELRELALDPV